MNSYDFSRLSDKDLAETLAYMNQQRITIFRSEDEGTYFGTQESDSFFKQYAAVKKEAERRGIKESEIASASIRNWAREKKYKEILNNNKRNEEPFERISDVIVNNPTELFDREIITMQIDPSFKDRIYERSRDKAREKIRDYASKNVDGGSVKVFGSAFNPNIRYNESMMIEWLINCIDGVYVSSDYWRGVRFLKQKEEKGEKHPVNISDLLDFNKVGLIAKSFRNPVFLNWFFEGRLPAYSWSASSGEEMMRALKSGDYQKSYEAEMNLIDRAVRDIGESYGLGKN